MNEQYIIALLLSLLVFLFIWGKLRYDAVALLMLKNIFSIRFYIS